MIDSNDFVNRSSIQDLNTDLCTIVHTWPTVNKTFFETLHSMVCGLLLPQIVVIKRYIWHFLKIDLHYANIWIIMGNSSSITISLYHRNFICF